MELVLTPSDEPEQRHVLKPAGDVYSATVPPVAGSAPLRMTLEFSAGSMTDALTDRRVRVGDQEFDLSQLQSLRFADDPHATSREGDRIDGTISELDNVSLRVGRMTTVVDCSKAIKASVEPYDIWSVDYTLVARQGDREIARLAGPLGIEGALSVGQDKPNRVECTLPAKVADLSAGGSGRWLVLHLPELRQLAVFDVVTGKIIGRIDLTEDAVLFAAGLAKLIVVLPNLKKIERWDLKTQEREASRTIPLDGVIESIGLGSAATGPLGVIWRKQGAQARGEHTFSLMEVETLEASERTLPPVPRNLGQGPFSLRASADGRVMTFRARAGALHTLMLDQEPRFLTNASRSLTEHVGYAVPGPRGTTMYTPRTVFTMEGRVLNSIPKARSYLPAHHGSFFLGYRSSSDTGSPVEGLAIFGAGDSRPIVTLSDVDLNSVASAADRLTADERIHLVPKAKVLATIPASDDRIVLFHVDIDEALRDCGHEYLFVTSQPPPSVDQEAPLHYQLEIESKSGGLTFDLIDGPEGMSVSKGGLVTWHVPATYASSEVSVVVSIGSDTGEERFHAFRIQVR